MPFYGDVPPDPGMGGGGAAALPGGTSGWAGLNALGDPNAQPSWLENRWPWHPPVPPPGSGPPPSGPPPGVGTTIPPRGGGFQPPHPIGNLFAMLQARRGGGGGGGPAAGGWPSGGGMGGMLQPIQTYANGGWINEPVAGQGQWSGSRYLFGERGPEQVQPGYGFDPLKTAAVDPRQKVYNRAGASFYRGPGGQMYSQGPNDLLAELQRYVQRQGLAQQGAASRAAGYYGQNAGGGDPGLAGYAGLSSLLGSQSQTADAMNQAYLHRLQQDDQFNAQQQLMRLQASLQPQQQSGLAGILGGVAGSLIPGLGGLFGGGGSTAPRFGPNWTDAGGYQGYSDWAPK